MELKKGQFIKKLPKGFDGAIRMDVHTKGYVMPVAHVSAKTISSLMSEDDCSGVPTYYGTDGRNILFYPRADKRYRIDFFYSQTMKA